jgi:hypothetical protein
MDEGIKTNFKSKSIWTRGLFMLLFAALYGVAEFVLLVIAVFQFGHALFTGRANDNVIAFGYSVGCYIFDITKFVTFNSDVKPFPFSAWPAVTSHTEPPVTE